MKFILCLAHPQNVFAVVDLVCVYVSLSSSAKCLVTIVVYLHGIYIDEWMDETCMVYHWYPIVLVKVTRKVA